jgi:hypothetical protein
MGADALIPAAIRFFTAQPLSELREGADVIGDRER